MNENVKQIANEVAAEVMTTVTQKGKSWDETEMEICEIISKLDDGIPVINLIPNSLEATFLKYEVDNVEKFFHEHAGHIKDALKTMLHLKKKEANI